MIILLLFVIILIALSIKIYFDEKSFKYNKNLKRKLKRKKNYKETEENEKVRIEKIKIEKERMNKIYSKAHPGECRMANGEYPMILSTSNKKCKQLCAKYNWCLGIEKDEKNIKKCNLVTDKTLYEKETSKKVKKKGGYDEKIDGLNYSAYCSPNKECDNIGYITFLERMGIHVKLNLN